ncbi:hypothetical protein BJX64DRAFT_32952 [Aspergillus heterothallicus]
MSRRQRRNPYSTIDTLQNSLPDTADSDQIESRHREPSPEPYFSDDDARAGFFSSENDSVRRSPERKGRSRRAARPAGDAQMRKGYAVIYHVNCTNRRAIHKYHDDHVAYLDSPRLFQGDSKASALRGKKIIRDPEMYLERHSGLHFIIQKQFDCHEYHEKARTFFKPLQMPKDPQIPDEVEPYFYTLPTEGPIASMFEEAMVILSSELGEAVFAVTGIEPEEETRLLEAEAMDLLQHLLYRHYRLNGELSSILQPIQRHKLDKLFEYMRWSNAPEYQDADELFAKGLITVRHLAKLCGPNEILVTNVSSHPRAYMVRTPPASSTVPLSLEAWSWEFDGQFYKKNKKIVLSWPSAYPADAEIPITSLDVYPLRYAPAGVEKKLRARGEIFWQHRNPSLAGYDSPNRILEIQMGTPRYMVDARTYREMHPNLEVGSDSEDDSDNPEREELDLEAMSRQEPPDGPFVLLLPHEIRGFGFNDKKWRALLVERIKPVDWNDKAFDRLVMQHHKKELIKALVTVHTSAIESTDIIEGKGNALIILLHGGPGTGKTLTAESVAELTRKPLYRVTCGDIGTNPDEVEKYLESILLIGTIWGCVVLLDEADVFLEERRETDLQRNASVSVFLRVLEYYDGILFLTSNRIGTFDEAFKSRFQLAIHYPTLTEKDRYEIWLNFINGLSKTRLDVDVDGLKTKLKDLARVDLNGRQIRNTVRTASQLAHFQKERLDGRHFDRVLKVVDEFERHINTTRGYTETDWIHHQELRPEL